MDSKNEDVSVQALTDTEVQEMPRLTIVLHPNRSCIDIALNDRMFNQEKYNFSERKIKGEEKILLEYLNAYVIGICEARAAKNVLSMRITPGVLLREILPKVVTAVKQWGSAIEPYSPEVRVDDRRWRITPVYDEWDHEVRTGQVESPNSADVGLPYKAW